MMPVAQTMQREIEGLSVQPQAFEAAIFGAPVWRLQHQNESAIEARALQQLIDAARQQRVALISARHPADAAADGAFECAGFRLIERLLTFRREIPSKAEPDVGVTIANSGDADACAAIARRAFSFDRFHADQHLSNAMADEIKACWARNGVRGRADAPLIVRDGGAVAGFNLCMRKGEDAAIDLIAVDGPWRGRGIGRKLVQSALAHYAGTARDMWVSTQEANTASIALYLSAGFSLHGATQSWHWTPAP